ncbi:hypothetical protein CONPUDRAFT_145619 [Coniophora puteana RWD-64-598 SS2]|uniref:Uncharacterized protein n=1 Tax=Coniophora puteana (strain RWD-64-598) TaxID=741705 RepID=A0A5M3MIA1_CONPW|nr:uncharacterized protein CONPUDRAFT_145619 [Coniophora puteana RWD-64-598 SS2]EIW78361.1 hypothetical protein CONPUDRAFT_145619 [Coniophora puteana RWD-64-598 SS2]
MASVLAAIARVVPPSRAAAVLARYERKLRGYERAHGLPHDPRYWSGVYGAFARALAAAGHSQAALVRLAESGGHALPSSPFPSSSAPSPAPAPLPKDFTALPLSSQLRHIRTVLRDGTLPTPYALASFIRAARASGRTSALPLLRRRAFSKGARTASWWVLAEMLVARDEGQPGTLLAVFTRYCHAVNVPRAALAKLTAAATATGQEKERTRERECTHAIPHKLWPTPHHTALVWDAVAWGVPDAEVPALYHILLAMASKSAPSSPPPPPPSSSSGPPPPPQLQTQTRRPIDAAHFTPFIALHAHRARPAAAAAVLRDMVRLGLRPGDAQWGALVHARPRPRVRAYAHDHGHVRGTREAGNAGAATTLRILDVLETQDATSTTAGAGIGIGVYTGALRALVRAGQLGAARDVERRMRARFGYVDGGRAATDRAVGVLRAAEREGAGRRVEASVDTFGRRELVGARR